MSAIKKIAKEVVRNGESTAESIVASQRSRAGGKGGGGGKPRKGGPQRPNELLKALEQDNQINIAEKLFGEVGSGLDKYLLARRGIRRSKR